MTSPLLFLMSSLLLRRRRSWSPTHPLGLALHHFEPLLLCRAATASIAAIPLCASPCHRFSLPSPAYIKPAPRSPPLAIPLLFPLSTEPREPEHRETHSGSPEPPKSFHCAAVSLSSSPHSVRHNVFQDTRLNPFTQFPSSSTGARRATLSSSLLAKTSRFPVTSHWVSPGSIPPPPTTNSPPLRSPGG